MSTPSYNNDSAYGSSIKASTAARHASTSRRSSFYKGQRHRKARDCIRQLRGYLPKHFNPRDFQFGSMDNAMKHSASTPITGQVVTAYTTEQSDSLNTEPLTESDSTCSDSYGQNDWFQITISQKDSAIAQMSQQLIDLLGYPQSLWQNKIIFDLVYKRDLVTISSHLNIVQNGAHSSSSSDGFTAGEECPKNMFYFRLKNYKGLRQGFALTKTDRFVVFSGRVKVRRLALLPFGYTSGPLVPHSYAILECKPVESAFNSVPEKQLPANKAFQMRHSPLCNYSYMDPSATSLLGYLPQDVVGMSVFDAYHPDDLAFLYEIYKKVVQSPGERFQSPPMRFKVRNGDYIQVVTDWSSYLNPFSQRIDFISCQHVIIRPPQNPDVFSDQQPKVIQSLAPCYTPATKDCAMWANLQSVHRLQWKIRTLLSQSPGSVVGRDAHKEEPQVSDIPKTETRQTPATTTDKHGHTRTAAAETPLPKADEDCKYRNVLMPSGREVDINLVYDGLNYDHKVRNFLLQMGVSPPKKDFDMDDSCFLIPDKVKVIDHEQREEEHHDDLNVEMQFLERPLSFASSVKMLVSLTNDQRPQEKVLVSEHEKWEETAPEDCPEDVVHIPNEDGPSHTNEDYQPAVSLLKGNQAQVETYGQAHKRQKTHDTEEHKQLPLSPPAFPVTTMEVSQLGSPPPQNDHPEHRRHNIDVKFIPRPPSFASSTKALVSEHEKFEEVMAPSPVHEEYPDDLDDLKDSSEDAVTTTNESSTISDDYCPVSLTEEVLLKHHKAQVLAYVRKHKRHLLPDFVEGSIGKKSKNDPETNILLPPPSRPTTAQTRTPTETNQNGSRHPQASNLPGSTAPTARTTGGICWPCCQLQPGMQWGFSVNGNHGTHFPRPTGLGPIPHPLNSQPNARMRFQVCAKRKLTNAGKPWNHMIRYSDTSVDETESSFFDYMDTNSDKYSQNKDQGEQQTKRAPKESQFSEKKNSQQPFWLNSVNWTHSVAFNYTMPRVIKNPGEPALSQPAPCSQPEGALGQLSELLQSCEEECEVAVDEEADVLFVVEGSEDPDQKDPHYLSVDLSNANRSDSRSDETEGESNSIEDSNSDLEKFKMPTLQKVVQASRPQADKMSNDSHSSSGKGSSELTPSDQRSHEELGSSIKESDCASASNVSHSGGKCDSDCAGPHTFFCKLFVPLQLRCESKPTHLPPWVENANYGDHICMTYQHHFINTKEILQQTRDIMHSMQQPLGLHDQLRELFADAICYDSMSSSEQDEQSPSRLNDDSQSPAVCHGWQLEQQEQEVGHQWQEGVTLDNNDNSDEGINSGDMNETGGSSGQDQRSPGEGSGGITGSGDQRSSQCTESGFSSMKTTKPGGHSSGTSDTPPQEPVADALSSEWKDSPDCANCGQTYPDRGRFIAHLPEFDSRTIREGATIMEALFSRNESDIMEAFDGLLVE